MGHMGMGAGHLWPVMGGAFMACNGWGIYGLMGGGFMVNGWSIYGLDGLGNYDSKLLFCLEICSKMLVFRGIPFPIIT